jgi:hypothetical protein
MLPTKLNRGTPGTPRRRSWSGSVGCADMSSCSRRAPTGSKLDPFREWICEQLRADPSLQSLRLREMAVELGYEGGKSIFDDYAREVRRSG